MTRHQAAEVREVLERCWRERPYSDLELAARVGLSVDHLASIRHRYFKGQPFRRGRNAHGQRTFQLGDTIGPAKAMPEPALVLVQGFTALVQSQARELDELRALVRELETVIVNERLVRRKDDAA